MRSRRNIVFPAHLLDGKRAAAVDPTDSFALALHCMLLGAGISAAIQPDGSVILSAAAVRPVTAKPGPTGIAPAMPPASTVTPVVVVAGRSLAATSAARADTSLVVVSGPDQEDGSDRNAAEALGRIAGVTVLDGGPSATNSVAIDFAARGEGDYTSLRGLDAEFNLSLINGVEVAQSQPYSRGVQLNLLPTTGLSQLVVVKSMTADMDGQAIGGILDFKTPTAFDFSASQHIALTLGGQVEDQAVRYARNPFGRSFALEGAELMGSDQAFGLYAAGYFSDESYSNGVVDGIYPATENKMFTYARETAAGASAPGIDPARNLVLTGLDAGVTTGQIQRYGGAASFDWRPRAGLGTFVKLNIAVADIQQATVYEQIYGDNIGVTPIASSAFYAPMIANLQPRYYYETNPETSTLDTLQMGGSVTSGRMTLTPKLFASWGETNDPDHFELSGRQPEVKPELVYGGSALFATTSGGAPIPLLNASQLQAVEDISAYGARRAGELSEEFSNQFKYGSSIDSSYRLDRDCSILWGMKYVAANLNHTYRDYLSGALYTTAANDPTLAQLGILAGSVRALVPGVVNIAAPTIDSAKALALFNSNVKANFGGLANSADTCSTLYINNYNCDTQHGLESVTSAYLMGRFVIGDLELLPGLRFEHDDVRTRFWVMSEASDGVDTPGRFSGAHTVYNEPLPSLQMVYRPQTLAVYRASLSTSYVPPALFQLGGGRQTTYEAGVQTITEGNPNLKSVQAVNLDLSGDWANLDGGQVSAAVFYKLLSHYIYDTINAFTNATSVDSGGAVISMPHNGGTGRLVGLELSGRQRFGALPTPFNGLGVGGNLTLEQSDVDTGATGLSPHERLINQPDVEGNFQLFYEKWGDALRLSYRYIGPYVSQYGTLGPSSTLDTWVRASGRLDFSGAVQMTKNLKLTCSATNLLNNLSYAATVGNKSWAIPSLVYSGRTYQLSAKISY